MPKIISVTQRGNFRKTNKFLHRIVEYHFERKLAQYALKGVQALRSATPVDSGHTADHWSYEIEEGLGRTTIWWKNDNINDGVNIAVILQYGHGTRNGGYVQGIDYINPAILPVFEEIAETAWKEVVSS